MWQAGEPVILLAVLEYGELPELLRVAGVVSATLQCKVVFMFTKRGYRRLAQDTAVVVAAGFQWMDAQGVIHQEAAPPVTEIVPPAAPDRIRPEPLPPLEVGGRGAPQRLYAIGLLPLLGVASIAQAGAFALRSLARDLANCLRDMRRFRRRYSELHRILLATKPRMLIVGQDSLGGELSFLLLAAGRLRIPRLVTPFAMFSLQETADFALANRAHHVTSGAVNRVVAKVFPQWVLRHNGEQLLRLPGYRALALELTGLVQALPWTPLSEPVEAITASSEVAADVLVALGIDRQSLQVIGSPIQDRLADTLSNRNAVRQQLCDEYGLDAEKPLLVCGWPVNMFAWLAGRAVVYPDYPAVANAWARKLAEVRDIHGVNVIVSVHPKTLDSEIRAAEHAGLPCRRSGADDLIAACDVFTTLNGSSITAWAIACGVPVVLFDCFQTGYTDFVSVAGCTQVDSEEEFSATLHDFCSSASHRAAMAIRQQEEAGRWGRLDGKASDRLADLIRQLDGASR